MGILRLQKVNVSEPKIIHIRGYSPLVSSNHLCYSSRSVIFGQEELTMSPEATDIMSYRPAIVAFILKLTGDHALAEDIAQETFARATQKVEKFRGESSLQSWVTAIALNLVRDHFRKVARHPETTTDSSALEAIPDGNETSEQAMMKKEMSSCIARYASQLPRPQYDVVILHDMAGLKHREIAAELSLSVANSRVLLHRGREALRQILERNCVLSFGKDDIPCVSVPNKK